MITPTRIPKPAAFGVIVAVLLVFSGDAHVLAQDALTNDSPIDPLAEIREMVLYARYREAIDELRSYLDQPRLDARARNAGLELLAIAQLATNSRQDADQTLQLLYARDRGHRLSDPDASPRIQGAFARARESAPEPLLVELTHQPSELETRRAPRIDVRLGEGADAVDELRLSYRDGSGRWIRVGMAVDGSQASVPIPLRGGDEGYEQEYFVEALAPSGAALQSVGSAAEPLTLSVPEPQTQRNAAVVMSPATDTEQPLDPSDEPGIASKPWFWVVIGAVVVGVAVGTIIAVTAGGGGDVPESTLGSGRLALTRF